MCHTDMCPASCLMDMCVSETRAVYTYESPDCMDVYFTICSVWTCPVVERPIHMQEEKSVTKPKAAVVERRDVVKKQWQFEEN